MNLIQSLQKTQTQRATQPVPGQAANLRKMLASKSGKAGATTGPAASGVQEQQALADISTAATQQQQQAQLDVAGQRQAQEAQDFQAAQAQQQLQEQQAQVAQNYEQAVTTAENNLKRLGSDIESKEGRAALADAIFTRNLGDKKYMTELNRQGTERRLVDSQSFELEAAKSAFTDWKELFEDEETFAQMMRADEADFRREVAQIDIDSAQKILASEAEAANRQAKYQAMGDFLSTGIQVGSQQYTTTDEYTGQKTKGSFFERLSGDKPITDVRVEEEGFGI